MRTLIDRVHTSELHYVEMAGLSSEEKPTTGIITGSKFTCVDTGITYLFDEITGRWYPEDEQQGG